MSASRTSPSAALRDRPASVGSPLDIAERAVEALEQAVRLVLEARETDPIELERYTSRCADHMGQLNIILCGVRYAAEEARRAAYYKDHAA